jgi:hypothetical protein
MTLRFFVLLGGVFGVLAAVMAYIITFGEYPHHFPDTRMPRKLALETALVTFAVFMLLALLTGVFFGWNTPD